MADFWKPSSPGIRNPQDNAKQHGDCINPPRYAEIGGLRSAASVKPGASNPEFSDIGYPFKIVRPKGAK